MSSSIIKVKNTQGVEKDVRIDQKFEHELRKHNWYIDVDEHVYTKVNGKPVMMGWIVLKLAEIEKDQKRRQRQRNKYMN